MEFMLERKHIQTLEKSLEHKNIIEEIINGLNKHQKELPTKLFYDEKGSILFDEITHLEEYI